MTPSEQYQEGRRNKRHRFLIRLFIFLAIIFLFPIIWLSYMTADYYFKIQSGELEDFDVLKDRRSISRIAANTHVTQEDLDRLKPSGLVASLGNEDARLTVVEFVDYQCPYCKQVSSVIRKAMETYGDQVYFVIRDFPITELHAESRDTAHAANCALEQGEKAYWRYQEILFANQEAVTAEDLRTYAGYANINVARFDECMNERRYDTRIDQDIEIGRSAGVEGTPTFFVNGVMYSGALTDRMFKEILDYFLAELPK